MNFSLRNLFAAAGAILIGATSAAATGHALLIGAGRFPNAPGISSLEGPSSDVPALRAELIEFWGLKPENIVVLVNETASRQRILQELERLADRAQAGDDAILYYSGHGTSAHDPHNSLRLDLSTGALVPADLKTSRDPESLLNQLIVGTRDIRPSLKKLDQKGVRVLVLFDACYSGDSAKDITALKSRNAEVLIDTIAAPAALTKFNEAMEAASKTGNEWPYRNVVYISASARHEAAWDISAIAAKRDRPTIDGQPHGAFTNALLAGLKGSADTNHDRKISYAELHGYLVRQLARDGQTPQLHSPDGDVARQPISGFNLAGVPAASSPAPTATAPPPAPTSAPAPPRVATKPLRVRMQSPERNFQARLAALPGVQITTEAYDLEIVGLAPRFRLMHSGGGLVTPNTLTEAELLRVVGQQARAHQLVSIDFPAQDFNIELSMKPEQGAYYLGERATIELIPERDAWILALDVDVEGNVYVVYPKPQERQATRDLALKVIHAVEVQASEPVGTEIVHVFAFTEKPEGYDEFVRALKLSDRQLQDLTAIVMRDAHRPGRAQVQRTTYTVKN